MADELRCPWLAVHVEGSRPLAEAAQVRLTRNLDTARELGAEVIATTGDDVARELLRVARELNVTQIILGKPAGSGLLNWFRSGRLLRRLMQESGDIDLHVIKAEKALSGTETVRWGPLVASSLNQYLLAAGAVLVTGLVNLGLMALAGPRVPGLVFLLAVVVLLLAVVRVLLCGLVLRQDSHGRG